MSIEQKLNDLWDLKPELRKRSGRKQAIEILTGITYEEFKLAETINRYYRKLPRDINSHKLEHEQLEILGYNSQHIHDLA